VGGFWKAPRALVRMLAQRELTPSAYTLLHVIAESGADREQGIVTSNGFLSDTLGWHERTVRRTLRALRALGFIAFDDHPGVATFVVRISDTVAALECEPRTQPRTQPRTSGVEVLSEVASDTASDTPALAGGREPAPAAGSRTSQPRTPRARARGRAETETETDKNPPKPPLHEGGAGDEAGELSSDLRARGNRRDRPVTDVHIVAWVAAQSEAEES
jgi:hypothetical protein